MTETKGEYKAQRSRRAIASALLALASWGGGRNDLARAVGQTTAYGGKRDYNEALGYIQNPDITDYREWYARSPYAKVAVNLPVDFTWKEPPAISEDGKETPFTKAWNELAKKFRVWSILSRLDRSVGLGRYGVLMFGLRNKEAEALNMPVEKGGKKGLEDLLFLRIAAEDNADITIWDVNQQSERFGMPEQYNIQIASQDDESTIQMATNWTRILHVAEGKGESEVFGTPRLGAVINSIMDEMKIGGGSAEATWLNMRPGTFLKPSEGFDMDFGDEALITRIETSLQEYAHDPLRILRLTGMEMGQIGASEVVDPTGPHGVILEAISTGTRIPQRVLVGSAQGQLAAAQEDTRQWLAQIADRQELFAGPEILRPFIDKLIWYGILPEPSSGEYDVGTLDEDGEWRWPSLFELTDLELSQIAQNYSMASKNLTSQATMEAPNTESEARGWLGLSAEKEEEETAEVESNSLAANVVKSVLANFIDGQITAEQLAEYVIAVLVENAE